MTNHFQRRLKAEWNEGPEKIQDTLQLERKRKPKKNFSYIRLNNDEIESDRKVVLYFLTIKQFHSNVYKKGFKYFK